MSAGSLAEPTTTKSLYMTSKRFTPPAIGHELLFRGLSCTNSTSPSPFRAFLMAWPVPTATTRTSMPVFFVKAGSMCLKRPEFSVDVVDWTMMNLPVPCPSAASRRARLTRRPSVAAPASALEPKSFMRQPPKRLLAADRCKRVPFARRQAAEP